MRGDVRGMFGGCGSGRKVVVMVTLWGRRRAEREAAASAVARSARAVADQLWKDEKDEGAPLKREALARWRADHPLRTWNILYMDGKVFTVFGHALESKEGMFSVSRLGEPKWVAYHRDIGIWSASLRVVECGSLENVRLISEVPFEGDGQDNVQAND